MTFTLAACLKHNESPEEKSGAGEKPPGAACFFRYYVGKLWKSIGTVGYLKCSLIKRLAEKEIVIPVRVLFPPAFIFSHIPVHICPKNTFPSAQQALYTVPIRAGGKRL